MRLLFTGGLATLALVVGFVLEPSFPIRASTVPVRSDTTHEPTAVAVPPPSSIPCALDFGDASLVTVEEGSGTVRAVDPCTGAVTRLGSVGHVNIASIAPIPDSNRAWAVDYATHQLLQLDLCTGEHAVIGPTGNTTVCGLVLANDGALIALDRSRDALLSLDTTTGAATVVGELGLDLGFCGLAYDAAGDRLLAIDKDSSSAVEIDRQTGRAFRGVRIDVPEILTVGVEYHPGLDALLFTNGRAIYRVDPASGATTLASVIQRPGMYDDLAFTGGALRCKEEAGAVVKTRTPFGR